MYLVVARGGIKDCTNRSNNIGNENLVDAIWTVDLKMIETRQDMDVPGVIRSLQRLKNCNFFALSIVGGPRHL